MDWLDYARLTRGLTQISMSRLQALTADNLDLCHLMMKNGLCAICMGVNRYKKRSYLKGVASKLRCLAQPVKFAQ